MLIARDLLNIWILVFIACPAWAQLDSSSALLLRSSGRVVSPENLESSLYNVRAPESKAGEDEDPDNKPGQAIASPVAPKSARAKTQAPAPTAPSPPPRPSDPPPPEPTPVASPATPPAPQLEPGSVTEQMRDLILGGSFEELEEYKRQLPPQDTRKNMLEISFAPAFFYEGSESSYSFRRYTSRGPGFGAVMGLWLTPFFGLSSNYFSSVTGAIDQGARGSAPLDLQMFEAGLRFRRHFGWSRRAPQLIWGLDYQEKTERVSRDSTQHIGNRSAGLGLMAEALVPSSLSYAHTFSIDMQPRLNHSEKTTGTNAKSGNSNQSNALRLSVGGQWTLDRRHFLFWKTQYRFERNLFQGAASVSDPQSGQTPSDVAVSNSMMMIYFGFKWGS